MLTGLRRARHDGDRRMKPDEREGALSDSLEIGGRFESYAKQLSVGVLVSGRWRMGGKRDRQSKLGVGGA